MRTEYLLIGISLAVLLSYWFMHLGRVWRLPAVVFLLAAGLALRALAHGLDQVVEPPTSLLPLLGALGLILIVLEGALDLELKSGQRTFHLRTFGSAVLGLALFVVPASALLHFAAGVSWAGAVLVTTPFAVISSAVAIPAGELLARPEREFVVYESSWSDILGVMLFNIAGVALQGGGVAPLALIGGGLTVLLIGGAIGLGVYWLVGHLEGHVKFAPLVFALILVYGAAEALHLSSLLIVMILGLILNNAALLHKLPLLARLHSDHYPAELDKLKHLTAEATFLVRTFFFLLLGYNTAISELADYRAFGVAALLVMANLAVRWVVLKLTLRGNTRPLLWMTPRGLITVLLFYSLPAGLMPAAFPRGALILTVLLSCVVMAMGLRVDGAKPESLEALPDAAE